MSVPSFFSHKAHISEHLASVIAEQIKQWSDHDWAQPLLSELLEYAKRGKMVRGSVLIESWRMYAAKTLGESQPVPESVLTGAVIIELLESALLIHDDIIDRDELRRGMPSFHTSMRKFFTAKAGEESHGGLSLALLTGDITFFIVFSILGHLDMPAETRTRLITTVSDNLLATGFGQTIDTVAGLNHESLSESQIMDIHRFKTGRYSFSLPLEAGAILAGVTDRQELMTLRSLGETLGLIYQTADDGLSIFGKDAAIGKKVGNDIREAKQTLYIYNSVKLATETQRQRLRELYGKKDISEAELEEVRELFITTGAVKAVDLFLDSEETKAKAAIKSLHITQNSMLQKLMKLIRYRIS